MINLRLARVQVQLKQADAALKTLDTIKGEGWAAIVADLRGEALLSKGDKQGARSAWEAGVKSDVTPALSEMMQMKLIICPSERDPMQLRKLLLPGLLSVTLLSGCSLFNSEEDVVKMSPLPTVENQFTPTTAWSTSVGSGIGNFYSNLHPALADNVVYAADRAGLVKALNADDGKEIWSVSLAEKDGWFSKEPALLSGGLTVSGGHVYIGSEKAQVYALNTSDGTVAWQTKVAGEALSRPVVSDGLVLIHTSNGQLQALNEADGAVKWTVNLDMPSLSLRGESAPATAFGAAVVGGDNGRVSAVLMEQGQMIWQQRISQATGSTEIDRLSDVDTTPVVVNGVVFALAYNGNLTALDLRSGQIMWKRELGSVNDFIVDGNRIYLVDQMTG